ncbi:MAG: hypothetical protein KJ706_07510 [Candidatus Omnitrophica bacterium]|nr:hypothetical protein [Candidatus Omnitrophota bacterium]
MAKIKIGETYSYSMKNSGSLVKTERVKSENALQDIIKQNTEFIFGRKILWISEKGNYGDMFGLSEDKRLIVVEIKGPKSRGLEKTRYGLPGFLI